MVVLIYYINFAATNKQTFNNMVTKVFSFKWKEGKHNRLYESFCLQEGLTKVLSFVSVACSEGLQISGISISCVSYYERKNNINLRSI